MGRAILLNQGIGDPSSRYVYRLPFLHCPGWADVPRAGIACPSKFKMFIDGSVTHSVNDIRRLNRIYARQRQALGTHKALDDIPDSIILVPLSLDKKMAKISTSSEFIVQFQTGTSYTVQMLYQRLQRLDVEQSIAVAQQQNPAITNEPHNVPVPISANGQQRVMMKPIYRKLVRSASPTHI